MSALGWAVAAFFGCCIVFAVGMVIGAVIVGGQTDKRPGSHP